MKNRSLSAAAIAMLWLGAAAATEQASTTQAPRYAPAQFELRDSAWYSQFTFTWEDENGTVHTSNVAQEATHPNHIKALLNEVYFNPAIPGTKTLPVEEDGTTVDINYSYMQYSGKPLEGMPYNIYDGHYNNRGWYADWQTYSLAQETQDHDKLSVVEGKEVTVDKHGLTMFMVEVKDDYTRNNNQNPAYLDITDARKVFEQAYKRVKLITKAVRVGEDTDNPRTVFTIQGDFNRFFFLSKGKLPYSIYDSFFEEYSPATESYFENGSAQDLWARMIEGESYPVAHDCADVAYRGHYFTVAGDEGKESHNMNLCLTIPDKRFVNWSGREGANGNYLLYTFYNTSYLPKIQLYAIKLQAQATPKASDPHNDYYTAQIDWERTFDSSDAIFDETFELYVVGEDGTPSGEPIYTGKNLTHSYDVLRTDKGQEITYVVKSIAQTGMQVWSNKATVYIPPKNVEVGFKISAQLNSSYDSSWETNTYTVPVVMTNLEGHNLTNTGSGMAFKLMRQAKYVYEYDTFVTEGDEVGTMRFGEPTQLADGQWSYPYTITYNTIISPMAQDQTGTVTLNSTTGLLFGEEGVTFTDVFDEWTGWNDHGVEFIYVMQFMPDESDDSDQATAYSSNEATVLVLKTNPVVVTGNPYTLDEVDGEDGDEPTLSPGDHDQATFEVQNNPDILYYNVMRDGEKVGYAHRNQDGSYTAYSIGDDGEYHNTGKSSDGSITIKVPRTQDVRASLWWTEIERINHNNSEHSTFGTPQDKRMRMMLDMSQVNIGQTRSSGTNVLRAVEKELVVSLSKSAALLNHIGYDGLRLWRKVGDQPWSQVDLYDAPHQYTWYTFMSSEVQEDTTFLTFKQREVFDSPVIAEGETLTVQYVAHAYGLPYDVQNPTVPDPGTTAPALRQRGFDNNAYVAEAKLEVVFSDNTVTGIEDVSQQQLAGKVRVYGLDGRMIYSGDSQGMQLPQGVWIVTGTTGTRKVLVK